MILIWRSGLYLFLIFTLCKVYSVMSQSSNAGCKDSEDNCDTLITFIDICNARPQTAAFLCAKTCNLCNIDPSSLTNPTGPLPHLTRPTTLGGPVSTFRLPASSIPTRIQTPQRPTTTATSTLGGPISVTNPTPQPPTTLQTPTRPTTTPTSTLGGPISVTNPTPQPPTTIQTPTRPTTTPTTTLGGPISVTNPTPQPPTTIQTPTRPTTTPTTTLGGPISFPTSTSATGGGPLSCVKHRDCTVTIPDTDHGTCYYFYDRPKVYTDAKKICEKEGTHMVHLETEEEELRLHNLMSGLHHPDQFWLGMENINGNWMWTGNGNQKPVDDDLWEGGHDSNGNNIYAYNTPPDHWKAGGSGMMYRVMCEEN